LNVFIKSTYSIEIKGILKLIILKQLFETQYILPPRQKFFEFLPPLQRMGMTICQYSNCKLFTGNIF